MAQHDTSEPTAKVGRHHVTSKSFSKTFRSHLLYKSWWCHTLRILDKWVCLDWVVDVVGSYHATPGVRPRDHIQHLNLKLYSFINHFSSKNQLKVPHNKEKSSEKQRKENRIKSETSHIYKYNGTQTLPHTNPHLLKWGKGYNWGPYKHSTFCNSQTHYSSFNLLAPNW